MNADELRTILARSFALLATSEDELRDLDAAVGDGDLGITVAGGSRAAQAALSAMPATATIADIFRGLGTTIAGANPSSFSALAATGLLAAARVAPTPLDRAALARVATDAVAAIAKRGKAERGDKTVLDALIPSIDAIEAGADLDGVIDAARNGIEETRGGIAKRGRASWLAERSVGHADPGAVAYLRFLEAFKRASAEE